MTSGDNIKICYEPKYFFGLSLITIHQKKKIFQSKLNLRMKIKFEKSGRSVTPVQSEVSVVKSKAKQPTRKAFWLSRVLAASLSPCPLPLPLLSSVLSAASIMDVRWRARCRRLLSCVHSFGVSHKSFERLPNHLSNRSTSNAYREPRLVSKELDLLDHPLCADNHSHGHVHHSTECEQLMWMKAAAFPTGDVDGRIGR
jgi:hypothetical protein